MNNRPTRKFPKGRTLPVDRSKVRARACAHLGEATYWRPKVRGDCVAGPRPCPYVGCTYHLFLDARSRGQIKLPFGSADIDVLAQIPASCALDVADEGNHTIEEIAELCNVTDAKVQKELKDIYAKLAAQGWSHPFRPPFRKRLL